MNTLDAQYNKIQNEISTYSEKIKNFTALYSNEQDQKSLNLFQLDRIAETMNASTNLSEKQVEVLKSNLVKLKIDFQHALQAASETLCTLTQEGLEEEDTDTKAQALINIATASLLSPQNTTRTQNKLTKIIKNLVGCINTHMASTATKISPSFPIKITPSIEPQAVLNTPPLSKRDILVSECISKLHNKELLTKFMAERILPLLGNEADKVLELVKDEFSESSNYAIDTSYHKSATWFTMNSNSTNKSLMVQIALRLVDKHKKYLSMDKPIFILALTDDSPVNILTKPTKYNLYNQIHGSSRGGFIQNLQFEETLPEYIKI